MRHITGSIDKKEGKTAVKNGVTGYLGPEGTYSQLAADKLCAGAKKVAYPSFFTLFNALENGEVDSIVLPIENS
ncbi:MAG: hypothetical protein K2O67_01240, partial [Clostridia bacterium]|nr:hypothetical protein [Clostridia bacterium]